jgi:hypothetical protein
MSDAPARPSFTGLLVHYDPIFNFSYFVPDGWYRQPIASPEGTGVIYLPDPADPFTGFSSEGRDLGIPVEPGDLPTLRAGFLSGLRRLPGAIIEDREAEAIGDLITMEARHTYRDGKIRRKRWVRLLYRGSTQVRLVAQGATVEQFHYWLPMFFESMRTFRFGDWAHDAGVIRSEGRRGG